MRQPELSPHGRVLLLVALARFPPSPDALYQAVIVEARPPRASFIHPRRPDMDQTTLLIILILVLLIFGGGWYGRGRWF